MKFQSRQVSLVNATQIRRVILLGLCCFLTACSVPQIRGTGDLGVIVEREKGRLAIVDTSSRTLLETVPGLGDLSHASVVFSRDTRFAFVFGRDGALTKVDLLKAKIEKRIQQGGNSIGGAISQDGSLVASSNYVPGGVKVFKTSDLTLVADIPSLGSDGKYSKVVGLVDAPGNQFVFSLFEAGEIWVADLSRPEAPGVRKFSNAGKEPYDALVTPEGRYYLAGLFGEDGISVLDLWHPETGVKRVLPEYGKGEQKLPVYKMPHFEGWAISGSRAFVPGVGRHELVVVDMTTWKEIKKIPVAGQPVFAMVSPDGRQVWVNFALPDNHKVQVLDVETLAIQQTLEPGKAVLHMEFAPKGENVWISVRDENRVEVYNTRSFQKISTLSVDRPSGIFFTPRAHRIGL